MRKFKTKRNNDQQPKHYHTSTHSYSLPTGQDYNTQPASYFRPDSQHPNSSPSAPASNNFSKSNPNYSVPEKMTTKNKKPFYAKWWLWFMIIIILGIIGGTISNITNHKENNTFQSQLVIKS